MTNSESFTWLDDCLSISPSTSNSVVCNSTSTSASSSPTAVASVDPIAAYAAATALPVILENGRKVFGPPPNYKGTRPTYLCELFIARVPEQLDALSFLVWLHRCGSVYEFRLMMDSGNATRGYAFIRFTRECEALAAFELLSFFFVSGERLSVFRSQGKNRLYISSIPKQMPLALLEAGFQKTFPEMQSYVAYPAKGESAGGLEQNRGYAFIEFNDHEDALEAKKRTTPGRVRMWDCDLKVQWAKPKTEAVSRNTNRRLFNNDDTPPVRVRFQNDYCSKLRLYCLANNWCIPVVVYGNNFREHGVQYGAILLKHAATGECSYIIMQVTVARVYDIHVLLCEVAVHLVECDAGLPKQHHVVRVVSGLRAELLHSFEDLSMLGQNICNIERDFISSISIYALATTLEILAQYSSEKLLMYYKRSFLSVDRTTAMPLLHLDGQQMCGELFSIFPKYRNNVPLHNNFNDTEITLLLSFSNGSCNASILRPTKCSPNTHVFTLKSQRVNAYNIHYALRYVDAHLLLNGLVARGFYHPAQQFNSHPIWIAGHTYQKCIFEMK